MRLPHPKSIELAARVLEARFGEGAASALLHIRTDATAWAVHEVAVRILAELAERSDPASMPPRALVEMLRDARSCTCQRFPTHCANDCPLHGLEEPSFTAGEPDHLTATEVLQFREAAEKEQRTSQGAATEIGELVNRIMALAPKAGLYVGIKITPLRAGATDKTARAAVDEALGPNGPGPFPPGSGLTRGGRISAEEEGLCACKHCGAEWQHKGRATMALTHNPGCPAITGEGGSMPVEHTEDGGR